MLGPYIKFRGNRGTKMSANADLSTMETYYNKMEQFDNQFFIYGEKCTKMYILGYSSIIRLGLSYLSAILSPISMYM